MSEDNVYKDGDVVWVKLGNSWWPGEIIGDEKRLPDDVHQFKKRPYCVVKFFQEDAYEYPKTAKQVYPFQCSKKNEFIKKGLALFNAKKAFMEKFPDDVKHAENLTKPATTTRTITDRPGGLVKEMWGHGLTRRSTDYYENSQLRVSGGSGTDSQNHATSRRDSVTTILNITPNRSSISTTLHTTLSTSATSARTLSTSSSASITPNTAASSQYRCNLCDFTTMRQNVLIMHRKSHSSSGKGPTKMLAISVQASTDLTSNSSSILEDRLNVSTKIADENASPKTDTSTPLTTKVLEKISNVELKSAKEKNIESTLRTRKRGSPATPSPIVLASSKRTLRNLRTTKSTTPTEIENIATSKVESTLSPADDDTIANKSQNTGADSPTDSKNSEQIRQRLLADWSDEEKDENHEGIVPSTSRKNKSSNTLQLPSTNVASSSIKRRSPTIVSMKTLEGAGQTLVVAAATQSNASQEMNSKTTPRIRNIPKKDRLRDFGNSITTLDEQAKLVETFADVTTTVVATSNKEEPAEKSTEVKAEVTLSTTTTPTTTTRNETEPIACTTSTTLSCFDFQEDEEVPENDVLKSIANYKKKYFSPDKDKSMIQSTTLANNEKAQTIKACAMEQRDKELSAEIDNLLENTTTVTQSFREDLAVPVSVKGLPIKERGKRIFKSRNRARIDNDEDGGNTVDVIKKPLEALDTQTIAVVVDEIKQETNMPVAISVSPSLSERKTRGGVKRTRGKVEAKNENTTTSPINGNAEKNKILENVPAECAPLATEPAVQSVTEMIYVSQRSRRKPYNHRIMRQLIDDEETSIPFIRHSPVEIYSCDSSMDNGTHVVRGRRSKTTTPNSFTAVREENVNGSSRTSSRNMNAAPLTPTDETSSLGVSDAGAEFGSPASSLDEERILTPVQDMDNNQHDNQFKPIKENQGYDEVPSDAGNNRDIKEVVAENVEEDEEIESPPHEALSGNELEDHEIKEGSKRLKTPKKKPNAKEQEKEQKTIDDSIELNKAVTKTTRKSRTGTPLSNVGDDLPKRLTRGALQQQGKESSEEVQEPERSTPTRTRSTRGSPANTDLKPKSTKSRSTPTKLSNRHAVAAATKLADEPLSVTSKPPSEESETVEQTHKATVAGEEKVPSPNRVNVESPDVGVDASPGQTKRTIQQQRKSTIARRSKTPAIEIESEKLPMEKTTEIKSSDESPKNDVLVAQVTPETTTSCEEEDHKEVEANKTPQAKNLVSDGEKDLGAQESALSVEVPGKSVEKHVEVKTKSPTVDDASCMKETFLEKLSSSEKSPRIRTSPHSPVEKSSKRNSPLNLGKNFPSMELTHSLDKNTSPSPTKKYTRWDSPHSSEKKNSSSDSLLSTDKKSPQTDVQNSLDKKFTRWDSLQSTDIKSSRADSPHSTVKKLSRWDSPLPTERKKKPEDSKSTLKPVEEVNAVTIEHLTHEITSGEDSKLQSSDSPIVMKVDGNGTTNVSDLKSSSLLTKNSTIEAPIVDNVKTPSSSVITSPTMEKVRINVDVANPLSTQIANILAASGNNSIHNQQQLRNKSPKSNISSPLKRKHSLEEPAADGDAVVAHMQSLCPQVKITRKERIITPALESIISSPKKPANTSQNTASHYDISQMPIVISNEQISAPKKSPRTSSALSVSNLWQTDLLQPPTTTTMTTVTSGDNQVLLQPTGTSPSEQTKILSSFGEHNHPSLIPRSSQSPSPQKSPAASTGGRKHAGNTVTLPSSITIKQHQHKFAEALALADSVLESSAKPTKRRNSQTTPTCTAGSTGNANANRRLNSAPALDVRSSPPTKIPKIASGMESPISSSPTKALMESGTVGKTWSQSQSHRQAQKQKKLNVPNETVVEPEAEIIALPVTSPSPTKITNTEENQNVTDVELNNTAKITAVPIQPIPGYAETFLLCMLVDNMYKPINNVPHYLNTDLNQLVPVPPEAYEGILPELAVELQPAASADNETTPSERTSDQHQQQHQMNATNQQQQRSDDKTESVMGIRELGGESSICSDSSSTVDETGLKLILQTGETEFLDSTASSVDPDISDGAVESATDNAIVLNLENQQIILDSATFEQLLANPDANTQLVTDDGTEFVLTREVLAALKAQHDGQNVELLGITAEQQQLQEQLIVAGGITEAGSSADLLSVALANSEFYGNNVLQIETTLGGGVGAAAGAAGLQLLASDGSIVFQAPPLPQAHLTPPITAHTSETNAVLNQTPIMSTLEKPSTALVGLKGGIESPISAIVSADDCDMPGMRPNLDDSLAVIGVSTQSSTVPTSLELPITITNPAIAPKVTMAQSAHAADLVQFQPHRSVATASVAASAAAVAHIYDDPIEGIN